MHQLLAECKGVEEDVRRAEDDEAVDDDSPLLPFSVHATDRLVVLLGRPKRILGGVDYTLLAPLVI